MKRSKFGEGDDFVEARLDLTARQAQYDAVEKDIFTARQVGMEPGTQLDEG